jgi:AcrR family transcriptional regulator
VALSKAGPEDEWEGLGRLPLPRGRSRLSREEVAENQRWRLIEAMAESVAARGYAATSVERVVEGAGVSRGTFYEHFANRHECLLAAHDGIFERLFEQISAACAEEEAWKDKTAAGIRVAIEFARRSPEKARLLALDTIAADVEAGRRGLAAADRLAEMLRVGRKHHPKAVRLPDVTERALIGAVASAVTWCLVSGESPAALEPQLVYLVLVPYLGPAAATRMAARVGERMEKSST